MNECPICGNMMDVAKREDGEKFLLCTKCDYEVSDIGQGLPVPESGEPTEDP
jgi:DNA-directed RNA polymerase subunit M/transcription elongation factor TFIIS